MGVVSAGCIVTPVFMGYHVVPLALDVVSVLYIRGWLSGSPGANVPERPWAKLAPYPKPPIDPDMNLISLPNQVSIPGSVSGIPVDTLEESGYLTRAG